MQSVESEFAKLLERSTEEFARSFLGLLGAVSRGSGVERARDRVATVLGQTMTLADLYGRRRVLLEVDDVERRNVATSHAAFAATPVVPNVPFSEAFKDILSREPRLAANAAEVAKLYQQRHAFALARSAETEITQAVQGFIGKAVEKGVAAPSAAAVVQGLGDFTRSYAQMVYRTNLTTAYTAGRFQQAQEPGVVDVLPAMERTEIMDSSTRAGRKEDGPKDGPKENHAAINGLILATRDARWAQYAPPAGYGCRGSVRMVSRSELSRRGLLTAGGEVIPFFPSGYEAYRPHPNFGKRRADLLIYGT